ncbi:MAG: phage portal protein [Rhodobacteraceae bacterium]|nr:MAG: phage portal protein [Paracoccaceae bacterium]
MKLFGLEITRDRGGAPAAHRVEPPLRRAHGEVRSSGAQAAAGQSRALTEIGFVAQGAVNPILPRVAPETAEAYATVFACCNNLAGDHAKVPLKLFQRRGGGIEDRVRDHPAEYLLNVESSPGVAAKLLRYALVYAWALRGNSYAYAPRDGGGELTMLELPKTLTATMLSSGRSRFYQFEDGAEVLRTVPSRSMAHLRYAALDGWTGRSPVRVAGESVGLALAGQRAAARTASGGVAKAVIKLDDMYESDEDRERNAMRVKSQITDPQADGIPVMGPGEDIKSLDLSAADQELLSSRKFDREQVAAIYRMPPSKLQMLEHGVKANGEQQAIDYLTDCLLHWSSLFEAQLALAVLTEDERKSGLFFRHDFGALLQPTVKDQYEALTKAVGGPILAPDEGRAKLGLKPIKGGDRLNPAPNMTRNESAADDGGEEEEGNDDE